MTPSGGGSWIRRRSVTNRNYLYQGCQFDHYLKAQRLQGQGQEAALQARVQERRGGGRSSSSRGDSCYSCMGCKCLDDDMKLIGKAVRYSTRYTSQACIVYRLGKPNIVSCIDKPNSLLVTKHRLSLQIGAKGAMSAYTVLYVYISTELPICLLTLVGHVYRVSTSVSRYFCRIDSAKNFGYRTALLIGKLVFNFYKPDFFSLLLYCYYIGVVI